MWKEVHCQGGEAMIHDDFSFDDPSCREDPGLSLRNMGMMKQLRTLEKSIQNKLIELEKDPVLKKESIIQKRVALETAQKELRRLERKTLDVELGQN
jgi:hypothetical protein